MGNYMTATIVATSEIEFLAEQSGGIASFTISHPDDQGKKIYLLGTLDELVRFADRIVDEVDRLRGEANVADRLAEAESHEAQRRRFEAAQ